MFVVGKKYRRNADGLIRECVWADATHAALFSKDSPGYSGVIPHCCVDTNPEYIELAKGYVNIWRRLGGSLYVGSTVYDSERRAIAGAMSSLCYVGTMEIKYESET